MVAPAAAGVNRRVFHYILTTLKRSTHAPTMGKPIRALRGVTSM